MPKISVIVPVYNVEKYLKKCINSILKQSFIDFELILVDDGSPDKSGEICDNYAAKDNRIKVIHKQNGGVSAARNDGIRAASGEYIMFVDSDDYIDSQMLESLLEKNICNADMVISSIKMVCKEKSYDFVMQEREYSPKELIEDYCLENFPKICFCGPCCKLYKKSVLDANAIKFNEKMSLGEDTYFNLQYISVIKNIITTDEIHYFYMRDNEDSLFTKFRSNYYSDIRSVYVKTCDLIDELECSDAAKENIIKNYANGLLSNVIKSVITAGKKESMDYMQKIVQDDCFNKNLQYYKKTDFRYIAANEIQKKHYNLVYFFIVLKYKFLK
ncbi:MAG: glycosyltransferase family 2 protein [Clostridia bacterium]|nr:glycosyltransferase family 2 protein [Clostridia bacterium]